MIGDKIEGPTFKYSPKEEAVVAFMRINEATPRREIRIKKSIGRLNAEFHWRSSKNLWGRFGGGWNWKLGLCIGADTVICDLLIFTIRLDLQKGS